jgi:iron complex outermembrane receptor protein
MKGYRLFLYICLTGSILLSARPLAAQDVAALSLDSLLSINVSTAARYDQSVLEAPASVTIVTAEQIQQYGYRTLADLLNGVKGFYLASDHQRTYLGIRGFNRMIDQNNRVLLLLNGHTLHESAYGSVPLGMDFGLDLNSIERVEIVRGPGSALYGTGALFAVINIITKQKRWTGCDSMAGWHK